MPKADLEEHARLITILHGSHWWKSGESFRAADMAQYCKTSSVMCATVLAAMYHRGEIDRRKGNGGRFLYRKPDRQLLRVDWRHDHAIYRDIEKFRREW